MGSKEVGGMGAVFKRSLTWRAAAYWMSCRSLLAEREGGQRGESGSRLDRKGTTA